jgi:hypothetical protein
VCPLRAPTVEVRSNRLRTDKHLNGSEAMIRFEDDEYHDDRIFVLHICRCTAESSTDDTTSTTVYHDSAPADARWCVITLRNTRHYPAVRADNFDSYHAARTYLEQVEPTTPLVSLGGSSPQIPLPYDAFAKWKAEHDLSEYDPSSIYAAGDTNRREILISKRI